MILPIKRIPDGHSVLSQVVEISGEQAQWLAVKNLSCRAEIDRIGSQLYIRLFYTGSALLECARCLSRYESPVQGDFRIVCAHASVVGNEGKSIEFSDEEIDFVFNDTTDEIDVTPLIYEEIMVSLPMKPLCSEQCRGFEFGKEETSVRRIAGKDEPVDPRWEVLKKLKKQERS